MFGAPRERALHSAVESAALSIGFRAAFGTE